MKLDRNVNGSGVGKYALIKTRRLAEIRSRGMEVMGEVHDQQAVEDALALLERAGIIDWGTEPETEFFVIRLKDKYADATLAKYAMQAVADDPEYASEVVELSKRAGAHSPFCKRPD